MSQSTHDSPSKSTEQEHPQQSSTDVELNASEIEKLYLKIKEDWL